MRVHAVLAAVRMEHNSIFVTYKEESSTLFNIFHSHQFPVHIISQERRDHVNSIFRIGTRRRLNSILRLRFWIYLPFPLSFQSGWQGMPACVVPNLGQRHPRFQLTGRC